MPAVLAVARPVVRPGWRWRSDVRGAGRCASLDFLRAPRASALTSVGERRAGAVVRGARTGCAWSWSARPRTAHRASCATRAAGPSGRGPPAALRARARMASDGRATASRRPTAAISSFGDVALRLDGPLGPVRAPASVVPPPSSGEGVPGSHGAHHGARWRWRARGRRRRARDAAARGEGASSNPCASTARETIAAPSTGRPPPAEPPDGAGAPARARTRRCCCCSTAAGTWPGRSDGRRKLDHAVDAALRLAKVSLDQGDLVGVVAFAQRREAPAAAAQGLASSCGDRRRRCTALEATLEESDYGPASTSPSRGSPRRSLVVLLTDLMDLGHLGRRW